MIRKCEVCRKTFESEGHVNGEWLNLCHRCNVLKSKVGEGSVMDKEKDLQKLYRKLKGML